MNQDGFRLLVRKAGDPMSVTDAARLAIIAEAWEEGYAAGQVDDDCSAENPYRSASAHEMPPTCPECSQRCRYVDQDGHDCGWCGECHPEVPEWD